MEILAGLAALAPLVLALLERWARTAPSRRQAALEADYGTELSRVHDAIRTRDGAALAALFEQERQQALRRGALDPRGPGAELHADAGAADRGPDDRPGR